MEDVKGCNPRCSVAAALAKTTILPIHDRNAAPTAIKILKPLLRFVNRTIRKKASRGGNGISQISASIVIKLLAELLQTALIFSSD
jgi:hypothetical protein